MAGVDLDDGDMARLLARTVDVLRQALFLEHLLPYLMGPARDAIRGWDRPPISDLTPRRGRRGGRHRSCAGAARRGLFTSGLGGFPAQAVCQRSCGCGRSHGFARGCGLAAAAGWQAVETSPITLHSLGTRSPPLQAALQHCTA